jgi:hypothetical protein
MIFAYSTREIFVYSLRKTFGHLSDRAKKLVIHSVLTLEHYTLNKVFVSPPRHRQRDISLYGHHGSRCIGVLAPGWHQKVERRRYLQYFDRSRGMSYQEAPGAGLRDNGRPETRRGEKVHY